MIDFRKVEEKLDVAAVARLAREIWNQHYVPIIGQEQVDYMLEKFQSEAAIAAQIDDGWLYYLAMSGYRPAGYIALVPEPESKSAQLSKIYVRKDDRGQGIGWAALELAEELCREAGLTRLYLTVNKHNSDSIAWYERMGFSNAGPLVTDIGGGFVMDDYRMEKEV